MMTRSDVLYMIKRQTKGAGLPYSTCCHTFRETGITVYLLNGITLEHAQALAAYKSEHAQALAAYKSLRTMKLDDHIRSNHPR